MIGKSRVGRTGRAPVSSSFEPLEPRRMLASAAAAVEIAGVSVNQKDEHGLAVAFFPRSHDIITPGSFLTGKRSADHLQVATEFLLNNVDRLGLTTDDIRSASVQSAVTDPNSGTTYLWLRQVINGITLENTGLAINIDRFGRVINASSTFVPGASGQAVARPVLTSMIHPVNALRAATSAIDVGFPGSLDSLSYTGGQALAFEAQSEALSFDAIPLKAAYFATADGIRLGWKTVLTLPDGSDAKYDLAVDAQTGALLHADNLTEYFSHEPAGHADGGSPSSLGGTSASYNVYPIPLESPYDGVRAIVNDPADPIASPLGWHDTNGVAGPEFTDTRGNNIQAQDDTDANNTGGVRADGGPTLDFNFPLDLTQAPASYIPAAVTNLFYWTNVNHDIHYRYGFTEQFWNFQTNNYGRGGVGNDHVNADAQDGSSTNNAVFQPSTEGSPARIQMYRFTTSTPNRDGDLDAGVITHEYGHGVSNRLTGRGTTGGLGSLQSGGMGEGWSDFFAMMLTQVATDVQNQAYPQGNYVLNQPAQTGPGIRRKPYSFDKAIDPLTWEVYGTTGSVTYPGHAAISRSTEEHDAGEIWASALWDMNWLLVNKHGFDGNLYTGYSVSGSPAQRAGNKLAMQLVLDGLKLQPTNPSFIQARDAVLQADVNLTGGANQNEIWQAFARRGLGVNAVTASASSSVVTVDFSVPWPDPTVVSTTPSGTSVGVRNSIQLKFSEPIDQSSFSVVDDVVSFTGPGGANLLPTITGSTWVNSTTLQINTAPMVANGAYALTIGPNIIAVDNGRAMDQDRDSNPGESTDDRFTATFSLSISVGPEAFGYNAAEYPVENIDLVIGAPGVTTLVNGSDDNSGVILLPVGTTFNYYGTSYTSVFANANGLVTLGAGTTVFNNLDLTASPTQAGVAILWDDWRTDQNTAGATDSAVLWKIEGNRLIIEWSDVPNRTAADGTATFHAILQLNTGAAPGRVIANYQDITAGTTTGTTPQNSGGSATVGIKDVGTQGTRRLLVSQNPGSNLHPWVQTGKAIVFGQDVLPPGVNSAFGVNAPSITSTFGEDVGASLAAGDVLVQNLTTAGAVVPTFAYNAGSRQMSLGLPTSLEDGNYRLTVASAGVSDAAGNPLDGDASGVAGGDHVLNFFFLRGDATGDRAVNIDDFGVLASNFNAAGAYTSGDFDYSGTVDIDDFGILAGKFNTSLAPSAGGEALRAAGVGRSGAPILAQIARPASTAENRAAFFSDARLIDDMMPQNDSVLPM